MGVTVAIPQAAKVVLVDDNQAIVVQPSVRALPIMVESGGPQGPPGEGGDLHWMYTQSIPSAKWIIVHNLGKFPSVIIQDSANDEVEGDIDYINENELIITFSAPFGGVAYLN
jgi:hypothetical protein